MRGITERKRAEALLAGEKRLLEQVARGSPLPAVLEGICRLFDELSPGLASTVMLVEGERMRLGAAPNLPPGYTGRMADLPLSGPQSGLCALAVARRAQVIAPDLATDPAAESFRDQYLAHGLRALWSTPFMSEAGLPLGTFAIFSRHPGSPTAQQLGLIEQFTHIASIAVERKRNEDALRLSEERHALAMRASGEGHWDWKIGSDEYYTSPRYLEILGLPPHTTSKGRAEALTRIPFHPEDRPKYDAAVAEHFAGKRPRVDIQLRLLVRGELRWVHAIGMCLYDAAGSPVRWAGSITDITEHRRAEEALRLSEERYALAMQASGEGHWDWNIATDEFYASPRWREISGFAPDETIGSRAEMLVRYPFHPADRAKYLAAVAAHFAGATPRFDMDLRITPGGKLRWVRFTGMCLRDAAGTPVRWAGSIMDITEQKRAEQALRVSEERYALALQASAEGHFDADLETDQRFIGERLKEIYGFAPDARFASYSEFFDRVPFHPEDRSLYAAAIAAAEARGGPERYEFEYRIVPRAGEVRWLRTRGKVTRDAEGRARRRTGMVTDITERKLAADELRESEQRFRALTELSSDWYWRQDENLRFTYVPHPAADSATYPREWVTGKTRWEVPGVTLLSSSWPEHQALLAARQPFRDLEYARVGRDGRMEYVSISGAPIFDDQGRFKGYQGIGRSITEPKRAEEELRSRQEMLELAQKAARAVAFDWRAEREEGWPAELEAMYGLAPGSFAGSFRPFGLTRGDWKRLVHPEDWPAVTAAIQHAHRTGDVAVEYRVTHGDGSVHWLQSKGRMFFDAGKNPVRMVGLIQDVTALRHAEAELKALERKLRQAQRLEAMGTLAGGIAHDFNNILGAILGYGEMAMRDAAEGSRLRRDLDSIMVAGERGRALVDRVLTFSRGGVGERAPVHVEKVAREALDLLSAKLPPNVTLHAKLHAGRAAMLGDATQVHQVLMNLATNAIQAMPGGGALRVSLGAERIARARVPTIGTIASGDHLVLAVSDTGTGIPPDILDRIFDPFFTTKEVGTGTGLGLSLVHGIVTEVGGAIDVTSTPGKGSTFTVYLPRSGDAAEADVDEAPALPRGDGQRVLIVDDEEPLVELAARTLSDLGYAPVGFTSSAAALAAFRADPGRFDALITDERMPGLSGSALIREVRGIRGSIPIVLMSGYIGGAVARQARESGAEEVLKKPLSASDLATSLARLLHP